MQYTDYYFIAFRFSRNLKPQTIPEITILSYFSCNVDWINKHIFSYWWMPDSGVLGFCSPTLPQEQLKINKLFLHNLHRINRLFMITSSKQISLLNIFVLFFFSGNSVTIFFYIWLWIFILKESQKYGRWQTKLQTLPMSM